MYAISPGLAVSFVYILSQNHRTEYPVVSVIKADVVNVESAPSSVPWGVLLLETLEAD